MVQCSDRFMGEGSRVVINDYLTASYGLTAVEIWESCPGAIVLFRDITPGSCDEIHP
jgi:hypothetical protein